MSDEEMIEEFTEFINRVRPYDFVVFVDFGESSPEDYYFSDGDDDGDTSNL